MRTWMVIALVSLGLACRREMPPRDYQNNPPAMTHPVTSSSQSPSVNGMPGAAPEPSKGAEGKAGRKPTGPIPPTLTLKDQPPVTQPPRTAATGTHLAPPP